MTTKGLDRLVSLLPNAVPEGCTLLTYHELDDVLTLVVRNESGSWLDIPLAALPPPRLCLALYKERFDYGPLRERNINSYVSVHVHPTLGLRECKLQVTGSSVLDNWFSVDFLRQGRLVIQLSSSKSFFADYFIRSLSKDEYVEWRTGILALVRSMLDKAGVDFPYKK